MTTNRAQQERPIHLFSTPRAEWPQWIVQGLIDLLTMVFPNRIRAVYLAGSRVEATAASVSDIDGTIIFKDRFLDAQEAVRAAALVSHCRLLSPLRLDMTILAEDDPTITTDVRDVRLKLGAHLVYGEDIREQIPLPALADYQAYLREWVEKFLCPIHDIDTLQGPLVYPEPEDEFYGYTRKRAVPWYPAEVTSGTKEWVATICWVATAWLALEHGCFVPSRAACIELAKQHLPAPWNDFVAAVYQQCKHEWDYQVPQEQSKRKQLRHLCKQSLSFFNDYLERH